MADAPEALTDVLEALGDDSAVAFILLLLVTFARACVSVWLCLSLKTTEDRTRQSLKTASVSRRWRRPVPEHLLTALLFVCRLGVI
jgi:hypothetical protein